jgi:Na+-transporting methylmalonyl-CoA/oxaloacetate decarboxylase gamma subunit
MNGIFNAITFDISAIDDIALIIFLIGMGVVFLVLLILYIVFLQFDKITKIKLSRTKKTFNKHVENLKVVEPPDNVDEDVFAAISMAIVKINEDLHDHESLVLTIKPVANTLWNSKFYNLKK